MISSASSVLREKLSFPNARGEQLAALLERPAGPIRAYALFAHCFTCSKNIGAATRVSRALAERGIAVLRFDFTGLGNSEGDFANTHFSSNVQDLISAADFLREQAQAPRLLIGHSLGGAAVLAAARHIPESRAVATLGAPSDPAHVSHLFGDNIETIRGEGEARVSLGGRQFTITRQFLEDISERALDEDLHGLRKALLILHAPLDTVVDIEHARHLFEMARHPKSFISLDQADHLLSRPADADFAAETIAAWAGHYLPRPEPAETSAAELAPGEVWVGQCDQGFRNEIRTPQHRFYADEPPDKGGQDSGPSPYELLLAALGACTSMTLRMYANFKKLPLERIEVRLRHEKIHAEDCRDCPEKAAKLDLIEREIEIHGELDDKQRRRMIEIANRCPVHQTLSASSRIETRLKD